MTAHEERTVLQLLADDWTVHEIAKYLKETVREVRAVIRRACA